MERQKIRARLPAFADRLPLGTRGLSVSPFCMGAVDDPHAVLAAFDRGINFFFLSADMHWPAYEGSRRGLAELLRARPAARDQIVVAAVSYVAHPDFVLAPFFEVLENVEGLGRLDVVLAGGVSRFTELEAARRAGICRQRDPLRGHLPGVQAAGATFHDRAAARDALADDELDVSFVRYNSEHPGAEADVFPHAQTDARMLLYGFKSVQGCLSRTAFSSLALPPSAWQPRPSDHYRFALSRPELDGILCAPQSAAQLDALAAALAEGPLEAGEIAYMKRLVRAYARRQRAA
jgi:hypothetical protein